MKRKAVVFIIFSALMLSFSYFSYLNAFERIEISRDMTPKLSVENEAGKQTPLRLTNLAVDVTVNGFIAETKMTMTFFNPSDREKVTRPVITAKKLTTHFLRARQEACKQCISGKIVDESGAELPGVKVTAETKHGDKSSQYITVTWTNGEFLFADIPPGIYKLTVELTGFYTISTDGIKLRPGNKLHLPFSMKFGDIAESIHLKGEARCVW